LFALGLLAFFLAQCMIIGWQAQKIGNLYGAFICFGIATLFGLQVIINLGVNTGLLPTKGLTLPFFSYGGSSLLICCVMVALVYRVSIEIDSIAEAESEAANNPSKSTKKSVKTKSKSVAIANKEGELNSNNEYVTGFDAYVEELNGGRDDK
jgi:cell division protein FtsW